MPKRKNKPGAGRPRESREKLTCYVKPETMTAINSSMNEELNTRGKVIDARMVPVIPKSILESATRDELKTIVKKSTALKRWAGRKGK